MVLAWLRAARPINVIIIGVIQCLLYYKLFWEDSIQTTLTYSHVGQLIITTCLITIGGYLINDYFDKETDIVNAKKNDLLSRQSLWSGYVVVTIIGLVIASILAYSISKTHLIILYFLAVGLLYYYSSVAKGRGLLGNIIVALFCTTGLLIILLAEWESLSILYLESEVVYLNKLVLLIGFSVFAGLITFIREVVKDVEDIEGDKAAEIRTFAVKYGKKKSRTIILLYSSLTLVFSILWFAISWHFYTKSSTLLFGLMIIPLMICLLYLVLRADKTSDYSRISTGLKVVMLNAIIYLYFT